MKLWFRAKRYGYGWTPCSWEGWAVLAAYTALMVATFKAADLHSHSGSDTLLTFIPLVVLYTAVLLLICYARGEEARWRWGGK